jgi:RHS repeat-associated protein
VTLSVHDLNGNRLAEHDDTGAVLREYIWLDGRPLAVVEGGQTYWLHWDHIGRPVMATDATGTVVWAARYLPFGGIDEVSVDTGAIAQNLRFPGQWFQAETGLHQNWMRDYDPTTGRYLQAGPLGLVDGASVYGYALANPGRYVDPRGEDACYTDQRTGKQVCVRSSETYCPTGECAVLDPLNNLSESFREQYDQCHSECMKLLDIDNFVEFRGGCMAIGTVVGLGTGAGLPASYPAGLICASAYCEAKCRKQCGLE